MRTELMDISEDLGTHVDKVLRIFARRCPAAGAESLDELRAGIIALARHHAAKTVHETVTRRTTRPRKPRCFR